ncbi:pyruvate kinase [Patescibacteria group bacterium]|nr:pyruvate kinase [Patescibacteria group bacterium]MBU2612979.1 pyruvate kinase [Patescibacteria group bacterium]
MTTKQRKRTKIVCTIGPSSSSKESIRDLLKEGMNVARLNFSHGTHAEHAELITRLRSVAEKMDLPLAIMQDLQGPKIRVGDIPKEGFKLVAGAEVILAASVPKPTATRLPVTVETLHEDVKTGDRILMDDGLMSMTVMGVKGKDVICKVVDGGTILPHKGVNFPDTALSVSAITEKDLADVRFGVEHGVDWVALSFVRTAKEIFDLRFIIKAAEDKLGKGRHAYPIRIIAKIEKPEAVKNIEEIVEAVDGIMVARGDLGIEMPAQDVPLIQKRLVDTCLGAAKPVIVATQMLDSMIRNPRPTRAEVSDVANAVIDHTDAIMLSGETASGKHPVEAVRTMTEIVCETEASKYDDLPARTDLSANKSIDEAISEVANILAHGVKARLILVGSMSGDTARLISSYRPSLPIYAATSDERVRRQMDLSWGVVPFVLPPCSTVEELVERSIGALKKRRVVKKGDKIIVVAGDPVGASGTVNLIEIRDIH